LERNASCNFGVSKWRQAVFAPNRPIQLSWSNTCSSPKKTMYARNCSIPHLVLVTIRLVLERTISCNIVVSRCRRSLFALSRRILLSWRNTCIPAKTITYAGSRSF
jgi:hypothetical protein